LRSTGKLRGDYSAARLIIDGQDILITARVAGVGGEAAARATINLALTGTQIVNGVNISKIIDLLKFAKVEAPEKQETGNPIAASSGGIPAGLTIAETQRISATARGVPGVANRFPGNGNMQLW
jgi:hypothetical protein